MTYKRRIALNGFSRPSCDMRLDRHNNLFIA